MSDQIKHECGIAMIRLLKPLEYYHYKYGSWRYGLEKMYILMEKQRNRGQDGAGLASLKFDVQPGNKYFHRVRSVGSNAIKNVFDKVYSQIGKDTSNKYVDEAIWAKENVPWAGDIYLGHLRYGTFGKNKKTFVHPVMRENNWKTRNLVMAGNFNLTNVNEIFQKLIELGQHPKEYTDTVTILENVGHFLDREVQDLFDKYKNENLENRIITELIAQNLSLENILSEASKRWDGGYVIGGIVGHGDAFVTRDPWGIRPCYYYKDDEICVVTSERPVIQTVFNLVEDQVKELMPGHALIIKKNGEVTDNVIREPKERKACSFERIYFSRGGDYEIYNERKKLGELLIPQILEAVENDLDNTVLSYIPNTAETAFYGMVEGFNRQLKQIKYELVKNNSENLTDDELWNIIQRKIRIEKTTIKDIKLRTFISEDKGRDDLVAHVYDVSYGSLKRGEDNLVVIDDSIVRGTTLRQSILRILDRLGPKKIVIVSSSPQIRYPDCYGIDMAKLGDFIAFKAAVKLIKETGRESIMNNVYKLAKDAVAENRSDKENFVQKIYEPFTDVDISNKISEMLTSNNKINAEVEVVYQTIDNLHKACPKNLGDWYFTGNYPTPGGNRVSNQAFINYIEGKNIRAY